jgi:hypothetical protein
VARTRLINPAAPLDEDVARLSMAARLLWAYLPCHVDREGRMKDSAFTVKASVFPSDDVDVNALLSELADAGHVVRYQVDGRRYLQVRNFAKYQSPHKNEAPSSIPPVPLAIPRESSSNYASPRSHPVSDPVIDPVPGISLPACDPTVHEQVAAAPEVIREAVAAAIFEDDATEPAIWPPAPRACDGPTMMPWLLATWTHARTAEFGGTGFGAGNGISPEKARDAAERIAAAPEAVPHVAVSMRRFWADVKSGRHEAATKIARTPSFAFAAWFGSFSGDFEAAIGAVPAIPAREARATGPPRGRAQSTSTLDSFASILANEKP